MVVHVRDCADHADDVGEDHVGDVCRVWGRERGDGDVGVGGGARDDGGAARGRQVVV